MAAPIISLVGNNREKLNIFLSSLLCELKQRSLRPTVIELGFDGDLCAQGCEELDSVLASGAVFAAVAGNEWTLLRSRKPISAKDILNLCDGTDIVIISGQGCPGTPYIELLDSPEVPEPIPDKLWAIVSDCTVSSPVPVFAAQDAAGAARLIVERLSSADPCWLPYAELAGGKRADSGNVSLSIDGRDIPLLPFVQDMIRQVNLGLISALKDTGDTGGEIKISISRNKQE